MPQQLCSSCRYAFPASGLVKAAFTDEVGAHFDALRSLIAQLKETETPHGTRPPNDRAALRTAQVRQEMEVALQSLCAAVHEESAALRRRAATAEEQRASRDKELEAASAKAATLLQSQEASHTKASHTGRSARMAGTSDFGPGVGTTASRASHTQAAPTFNGAVPAYQQKKMVAVFELVSASVYSLLESLAIETRADTALLWIRPRGVVALEMVAPFVVGRDLSALRASAPYRVPETSVPSAVSTTGTAVNVKPVVGVTDPRASQDIQLAELMEKCNVAQLLVPVFSRYSLGTVGGSTAGANPSADGDGDAVIAVIHLIGSPRCPFPFSRRNEDSAMHAARFLSSILSTHYPVVAGEWGNHFYQPDMLHNTSTFQGRLDLRGDEKGLDDFTPNPMLIYRCNKDLHGPTDPREAYMALRSAMGRAATPAQPVLTRVRDLHRHATNMEANWISAVDATTRLEHHMGVMAEETIKEDVQRLREAREAAAAAAQATSSEGPVHQNRAVTKQGAAEAVAAAASTGAAAAVAAEQGGKPPPPAESLTSLDGHVHLSAPVPITMGDKGGKSEPVLKPEEVDHLEAVTLRRLETLGVDTTAFLSLKP